MIQPLRPRELFLQVNITSRCNLACTHCYGDDAPADMDPGLFAKTIDQFDELRSRLEIGRAWVQLSGGEPLLHPDLEQMIDVSAKRFGTKILTNGVTIDSRTARSLSDRCESVQISFDGDREIHDCRRGAGSFEAALAGLQLLQEAGVPPSARITVGSDNWESVERLFRLLEPMIDAFHVSRVAPIAACQIQPPDAGDYRKVIYRLYALRAKHPKIKLQDPFFGPLMNCESDCPSFSGCSAGVSGLCVDQIGDIYPCRRLPVGLGNVRETSLAEVYLHDPLLQSLRARRLRGRCGECEHLLYCGGSRCVAFAATGDPLESDPGCIYK
jgi:AdoMet-dependent heme synthase